MLNLDFSGDYTEQFRESVDYLFDESLVGHDDEYIPHNIRIEIADGLIEAYVHQTGKRPPSKQLDRLATFIIKEDKRPRKGSTRPDPLPYPFLSETQYLHAISKERDWAYAQTVATSGVNKQLPTRSNRIADELVRGKVKLPLATHYGNNR